QHRVARIRRDRVHVFAGADQPRRVGEVGEHHLAERQGAAVGEAAGDHPVLVDRVVDQVAHRVTILVAQDGGRRTAQLGQAVDVARALVRIDGEGPRAGGGRRELDVVESRSGDVQRTVGVERSHTGRAAVYGRGPTAHRVVPDVGVTLGEGDLELV